MKFPIIFVDDGDVSIFASRQDLEEYVESPDAAAYLVFDAAGRQFDLRFVIGRSDAIVDVNPVTLVEVDGVSRPTILREKIRSFLDRVGVPTSDHDNLADLVAVLVSVIGYTK